MVIRQNEALCYNSFVSYNMTYTEEDQEHFYWGSKVLPTYEYRLRLADETCKVYFSGYFDQAYTSLRKGICAGLFLISFVAGFYLLFQKHIRYIEEMEQNVSSLCSKNFSRQIPHPGQHGAVHPGRQHQPPGGHHPTAAADGRTPSSSRRSSSSSPLPTISAPR